jgi:tripartite-type tricarboxylate transporter receptor subunit TctC
MISLFEYLHHAACDQLPFTWKDVTPVRMMALDEFVLGQYEIRHQLHHQFKSAAKANRLKVGGTGSKQEDQIVAGGDAEGARGTEFTYVRVSPAAARSRCNSWASTSTRR